MSELPAELISGAPDLVSHFHAARKKARIFPPTHAYVAEPDVQAMDVAVESDMYFSYIIPAPISAPMADGLLASVTDDARRSSQ